MVKWKINQQKMRVRRRTKMIRVMKMMNSTR